MRALVFLGSIDPGWIGSTIQAAGTLLAALVVAIAGGWITGHYSRERDRQDKESQWRAHAIELTKLDLERKLRTMTPGKSSSIRPSILDFLANYRDLKELGARSPKELYTIIEKERISSPPQEDHSGPNTGSENA